MTGFSILRAIVEAIVITVFLGEIVALCALVSACSGGAA